MMLATSLCVGRVGSVADVDSISLSTSPCVGRVGGVADVEDAEIINIDIISNNWTNQSWISSLISFTETSQVFGNFLVTCNDAKAIHSGLNVKNIWKTNIDVSNYHF